MNTRPLLMNTNRTTSNQAQTGHAMSNIKATTNYNAENTQKNHNKLYATNVQNGGNMNLFNNKVKMIETNKESCNNRQTPFYNPSNLNYNHPTDVLGNFTNLPQSYENKNSNNIDESLVTAFKNNPYTHSLNSAV